MTRNKLLRYRPYSTTELITPFDSLLNELFNDNFAPLKQAFGDDFFIRGSYPKVNVLDTDQAVVIEAAIPGMNKEDITLKIDNEILTISGASNQNADYEGATFVRREIKKTKFEWPDNIDEVALVDEQSNKIATTCYRHNPGR